MLPEEGAFRPHLIHYNYAFPRRRTIKFLEGLHRLVQGVTVGDQFVQRGLGINEEPLDLNQLRFAEGPLAEYGNHLEDNVPVEVDLRRSADPHIAAAAEGAQAFQHLLAGGVITRGLQSGRYAQTAGELPDRRHGVDFKAIDYMVSAQLLGQNQPLRYNVDSNDLGAHGLGRQRTAEAHRTLPKYRHGVPSRDVHLFKAVPCRASATGNCCAFLEGQLVVERHQRPRRHQDVVGISPVASAAAVGNPPLTAELLITHGAVFTDTTASVVVANDAVSDFDAGRRSRPHFVDHTAGFVGYAKESRWEERWRRAGVRGLELESVRDERPEAARKCITRAWQEALSSKTDFESMPNLVNGSNGDSGDNSNGLPDSLLALIELADSTQIGTHQVVADRNGDLAGITKEIAQWNP